MKLNAKLMAIGAVAVLVVSGLAVIMMSSFNAAADDTPVVTATDELASNATHNLTVQVMCKVNGTRAVVAGVNVTVCMMNITQDGNRTIVEIIEVAKGQTDENGTVTFVLPEGKYFVFAEHNGLRGFCPGNLSEDVMVQIKMHHWNWGHMKGEKFQYMHMFQDGTLARNGTPNQNCTGDMEQNRDRDGDMDSQMKGI
jgi:hypothetical protein